MPGMHNRATRQGYLPSSLALPLSLWDCLSCVLADKVLSHKNRNKRRVMSVVLLLQLLQRLEDIK